MPYILQTTASNFVVTNKFNSFWNLNSKSLYISKLGIERVIKHLSLSCVLLQRCPEEAESITRQR